MPHRYSPLSVGWELHPFLMLIGLGEPRDQHVDKGLRTLLHVPVTAHADPRPRFPRGRPAQSTAEMQEAGRFGPRGERWPGVGSTT